MSDEFDTTEKLERTDVGYRLSVESTRGSGTRDQDKIKAELRSEEVPVANAVNDLVNDVQHAMELQRDHQPDEEEPDDE